MDVRHFELQDLLAEALIALEAGNRGGVETALRKALAWVEHDWLATPGDLRAAPRTPAGSDESSDQDDDEA